MINVFIRGIVEKMADATVVTVPGIVGRQYRQRGRNGSNQPMVLNARRKEENQLPPFREGPPELSDGKR